MRGIHLLMISRSAPPEAMGSSAAPALAAIDWDTLRLTLDETRAIVARSGGLGENVLRALCRRSDGWPAGVTLLLDQLQRTGMDEQALRAGSPETVFDFFANEFFDRLPAIMQDFLLKTALLPHVTPTQAAALSGNPEAKQILADLHRRHFFIHRRELEETSYQYRALFREFLLARLRNVSPREDYLNLTRAAGRLLAGHGRPQEAVDLHLQAQDWEAAVPVLLEQAPSLLAQGRAQIVATWLQCMPQAVMESRPWLLYWGGMSRQFMDPFAAGEILERAYSGFKSENDDLGQMLVASAICDSVYLLRLSLVHARPWVKVLQEKIALQKRFPSAELEARLLNSLLAILMFSRPHDSGLPLYVARLRSLLDQGLDVNQRIFIAGRLLYYHSLNGSDMELCAELINAINPSIFDRDVTPINALFWRHMCIHPLFLVGKFAEACEVNRGAQEVIERRDLKLMQFIADIYSAALLLNVTSLLRPAIS